MFSTLLLAAAFTASGQVKAPKATTPTSTPPPAEVAPQPALDADTKQIRTIQLDPKKKLMYKLRLLPGVATTVQLPERWKEVPICGECVFGDAEYKGQLFRLDLLESTQTITVKNARLPGADPKWGVARPDSFYTNLDITLQGGATVTFILELTPDPNVADTRVEIELEAGAMADARRNAFDREMAVEFDARVATGVDAAIMQAALFGTKCRDFAGGPRRKDDMVVRMQQLCRNGKLLWVTFEVENRSSLDMALAAPNLIGENGVSSSKHFFQKQTLLFNDRTKGIAVAELTDPAIPPSSYTLDVVEDGGKGRTLTIDAIEF